MRTARLVHIRVAFAALVGLGLALLTVPVAQAYPSTVCSISVTPRHLLGGKSIHVTGTANAEIDWTFVLEAAGSDGAKSSAQAAAGTVIKTQTASGHGRTFSHDFVTQRVAKKTHLTLRSSCGGAVGVILDPPGDHNHGGPPPHHLPNTGGPALWLVLLGVALLGGGAWTIRRQRRA